MYSSVRGWTLNLGTYSTGLSVILLVDVVDIKGNTGKCRSEHEKIGSEGFFGFSIQ